MSRNDREQRPQIQDCVMIPILEGVQHSVSNQPPESEIVISSLRAKRPKEGCASAQCEQLESCGFIADLALKAAEICKPNPLPAQLILDNSTNGGKRWRKGKYRK